MPSLLLCRILVVSVSLRLPAALRKSEAHQELLRALQMLLILNSVLVSWPIAANYRDDSGDLPVWLGNIHVCARCCSSLRRIAVGRCWCSALRRCDGVGRKRVG